MAANNPRIVIYSEYVDNNGDLTFGCKLAAKLQQQHPDATIDVVTLATTAPKAPQLKGGKLENFNKDSKYQVQYVDEYLQSKHKP